ncbi:Ankyrin repeat domain-containing protein 46 [Colletotrichum gloeosporioides]|uniref:Ankyrin repeat domain-containing protein 46 n=1 Tax=Colletotrichum gloeosporioides TaxID=474922 RepID=A0A8H4CEI9_COLGL|nr:Ankyrin repeat domain-containing protein 46 [Colletotrichum gloeosporioides]KAF3802329.1 Ankyrin repeat domain-containing protein 46 [Colletotrichum gloeosporioides]
MMKLAHVTQTNNDVDDEKASSSYKKNEDDQSEDNDNNMDHDDNNAEIDVHEIIHGVALIHCAAIGGSLKILRILEESGANINALDALQRTPLHWAAFRGNQAVVEYLWERSDTELRDSDGRTALHLAKLSGHVQTANWLISRGGNI